MEDYGLLAQKLYQENFPLFGPTIIKSCTLNCYEIGEYNTTTGKHAKTLLYTQPLDVIFTSIKDSTKENAKVLVGDKKALFPRLDILDGRELTVSDEIVSAGLVWVILDVGTDPASAGYSLHVRRRPVDA